MRTISSIRTAALVVAPVVTACSRRAELRLASSQGRTTILDAVHAGADLQGRQS